MVLGVLPQILVGPLHLATRQPSQLSAFFQEAKSILAEMTELRRSGSLRDLHERLLVCRGAAV